MATMKQIKAFKEVVNGSTISSAMRKAGYSVESSKRTNKVTETDGWKELMEKHLPDKLLAKKHLELLNKKETIRTWDKEEHKTIIEKTDEIDSNSVVKGLDMAYKLKGRYVKEEEGISNQLIQISISNEIATKNGITEQ